MAEEARGTVAWREQTSAFDRVRSVAGTLTEARSADWIAEEAHVAPTTARDHLERLVEMHVLQTVPGEQAMLYRPDPLYSRLCALRELLDSHDRADLLKLRADIQEQLASWRTAYGVSSLDELHKMAAQAETAAETRELRRVAQDWELVAYRRTLLTDAIEHYADYSDAPPDEAW